MTINDLKRKYITKINELDAHDCDSDNYPTRNCSICSKIQWYEQKLNQLEKVSV